MTELTNDEIIKALECCVSDDGVAQGQRPCKECPLLQDDVCSDSLRKLSLDLIKRTKLESKKYRGKCTAQKREITRLYEETNRQKAEIESIRKLIMDSNKEIERLEKENEVMKTNCNSMCVSMPNIAKAERTEAIKEFAERGKDTFTPPHDYSCKYIKYELDNLVKELTHQPTKIEHNSLCETETYESR